MPQEPVNHSTFVIERQLAASPERAFAAFADPSLKRRWFLDGKAMDVVSFAMDFRAGGREESHSRFREGSPFPGVSLINHSTYLDIQPNERIVLAYTMTIGDYRMSASLLTLEFAAHEGGTRFTLTDQGAYFSRSDGAGRREEGWGKLVDSFVASLEA